MIRVAEARAIAELQAHNPSIFTLRRCSSHVDQLAFGAELREAVVSALQRNVSLP